MFEVITFDRHPKFLLAVISSETDNIVICFHLSRIHVSAKGKFSPLGKLKAVMSEAN